MQLSPEQERCIRAAKQWLDSKSKPFFIIFGYAGTGKTSIAKEFMEMVDGKVIFAAYTGMAVRVLQDKGCPAQTIHSLIYKSKGESEDPDLQDLKQDLRELRLRLKKENEDDEDYYPDSDEQVIRLVKEIRSRKSDLLFSLNEKSELKDAKLLVIDEASMIDEDMKHDLLTFNVPILVLGDPGQLPPVRNTGGFTQSRPDFFLEDVHRQAKESPIIELATLARQGKPLPCGFLKDSCQVICGEKPPVELVRSVDQVLVGRNLTRFKVNRKLRQLRGALGPYPNKGERLVCLKNDHDEGLLNGSIWYVSEDPEPPEFERIGLDLINEEGQYVSTAVHTLPFLGREDEIPFWEKKECHMFDFGYALTAHKAQGSQWDKVLIFDESRHFKGTSRKWLYTAITRAAKSVVIVQN